MPTVTRDEEVVLEPLDLRTLRTRRLVGPERTVTLLPGAEDDGAVDTLDEVGLSSVVAKALGGEKKKGHLESS